MNKFEKKDKSIKVNFLFSIIKTITTILFPLITFPYANRILGLDNIGKVQYCSSIISYFVLIATLGIGIYGVREGAKYKNNTEELTVFYKEILTINTISMFISYFLLFIYILLFFKESYLILLLITSSTIVFQCFGIEWLYQCCEDYVYISVRAIIVNIIALISMLIFVKKPEDFIIYGIINVFSTGGSFVFNMINSHKYIKYSYKRKLNLKKHIRPIITIFGISAASSIYLNLDSVMLGMIISTSAVGLYTMSVKVQHVTKSIISSFSTVLFSRASHYLGCNMVKKYNDLLEKGIHLIVLITIPSSIGMILTSDSIIYILSGKLYQGAILSSKILSINLFFSVINGLLYYQVLLPFKMERCAARSTVIGAISNILLNIFFIPKMSYIGASITTLVSEIFVFIQLYYYSSKCTDVKSIINYSVKYLVLSIPMVIYCLLISSNINNIILSFIMNVLGGAFIYFIMLVLIKDTIVINIIKKLLMVIKKI